MGPAFVPRVTDADEAKRAPFRALLSALAHGKEPGSEQIALAAWAGIEPFNEDEQHLWLQLLAASLNDAARKALEAMLNLEHFKKQTPFYLGGKADGFKEGLKETIVDLCEVLGIEVTEERRVDLNTRDMAGLTELRAAIKQQRAWPA